MNKEIIQVTADVAPGADGSWIDVESAARVRVTSENPHHPIESALLAGADDQGWQAAGPGPQTIWIDFNPARHIEEVCLCFETADSRTQEFVLSCSVDGGASYRDLVRQQFNFSAGAPREKENYVV